MYPLIYPINSRKILKIPSTIYKSHLTTFQYPTPNMKLNQIENPSRDLTYETSRTSLWTKQFWPFAFWKPPCSTSVTENSIFSTNVDRISFYMGYYLRIRTLPACSWKIAITSTPVFIVGKCWKIGGDEQEGFPVWGEFIWRHFEWHRYIYGIRMNIAWIYLNFKRLYFDPVARSEDLKLSAFYVKFILKR